MLNIYKLESKGELRYNASLNGDGKEIVLKDIVSDATWTRRSAGGGGARKGDDGSYPLHGQQCSAKPDWATPQTCHPYFVCLSLPARLTRTYESLYNAKW
jgi:hypothetical protein